MILASILFSTAGAIVLSEALGGAEVVYTRLLALGGFYLLCCSAAGFVARGRGDGLAEFSVIVLSGVPIMAAWLGFRIHVSNSITLEMADLLADGRLRNLREIADDYDVDGHTARRVQILRLGGYLTADADARIIDSPRSRTVLLLIRVLCGPQGPRSVADYLRRRDVAAAATQEG